MGDFFKLRANGGVDLWMIVAVEIGPNRRVRIQKFAALHITQDRSVPGSDYDRLALQPIPHLREWMPQIFVV